MDRGEKKMMARTRVKNRVKSPFVLDSGSDQPRFLEKSKNKVLNESIAELRNEKL